MIGALRMKPLLVLLLASAAFCFGSPALAQTGQAPTVGQYQTPQAERPPPRRTRPLREGVTGLGQTQDVLRHPRFIVEAVSFKAVDESGRDLPYTSDEVFATWSAGGHSMMTNNVEDVDTDDLVNFESDQSCIYPTIDSDGRRNFSWACDARGARGPIRFSVTLYDYDSELPFGEFAICADDGPNDLDRCHSGGYHDVLFQNEFSYEVSDILQRLDPNCRCLVQTASQSVDDLTTYEFTFRITRVDSGGEQPGIDATPDTGGAIPTPVVHRSGTLSALLDQDLEFDVGTVVQNGGDFDFSRTNGAFFLTPQGGARIWAGNATARGFATCYAERGSANYVTTRVALPAIGNHACYITSDGRIGEFRVDSVMPTPLGGSVRLGVTYTTWQ